MRRQRSAVASMRVSAISPPVARRASKTSSAGVNSARSMWKSADMPGVVEREAVVLAGPYRTRLAVPLEALVDAALHFHHVADGVHRPAVVARERDARAFRCAPPLRSRCIPPGRRRACRARRRSPASIRPMPAARARCGCAGSARRRGRNP